MYKLVLLIFAFLLCYICSSIKLNISPSERLGYYWTYHGLHYKKGDFVLLCLHDKIYTAIAHHLGVYGDSCSEHMPFLLKRIVAIGGDIVHVNEFGVFVNSILYNNSITLNKYNKVSLMPQNNKIFFLHKGEYFVLGDSKLSYDSRYFGIIKNSSIKRKAIFLGG